MNPEFSKWLENQTYKYVKRKLTGMWSVINEEYNNGVNHNWDNVIYRYKILERVRQLNK
jgi:hypothetical protein